jgi:aerobic carbon-monoxide dehydrogenase small subunit
MNVSMTVNGERVSGDVEPRQLLVHFIRETLGLKGTHWGCDTSNCGACVVLMDGQPLKSCTALAVMCDGHEIRTVESLEVDGELDAIHTGHADDHASPARREPRPDRPGDPHGDLRRDLPLHRLQEHRQRSPLGG